MGRHRGPQPASARTVRSAARRDDPTPPAWSPDGFSIVVRAAFPATRRGWGVPPRRTSSGCSSCPSMARQFAPFRSNLTQIRCLPGRLTGRRSHSVRCGDLHRSRWPTAFSVLGERRNRGDPRRSPDEGASPSARLWMASSAASSLSTWMAVDERRSRTDRTRIPSGRRTARGSPLPAEGPIPIPVRRVTR